MSSSSKKKGAKDNQKARNRSNKGKSIGHWMEAQMQAAFDK